MLALARVTTLAYGSRFGLTRSRATTQGRPQLATPCVSAYFAQRAKYGLLSASLFAHCNIILRRRNDADSRKQSVAGGSVLKYVTDGDNAADDEDAHFGERKYAGSAQINIEKQVGLKDAYRYRMILTLHWMI